MLSLLFWSAIPITHKWCFSGCTDKAGELYFSLIHSLSPFFMAWSFPLHCLSCALLSPCSTDLSVGLNGVEWWTSAVKTSKMDQVNLNCRHEINIWHLQAQQEELLSTRVCSHHRIFMRELRVCNQTKVRALKLVEWKRKWCMCYRKQGITLFWQSLNT